MKSLRYILLSYFQQNFFGILGTVIAFVGFFMGTILILQKSDPSVGKDFNHWTPHFVAFIIMGYIMAMHLKNSNKSSMGALLPHYRRNQLIVAGLVLALFILVPVSIRGFQGYVFLAPLAMFLFTAALLLWGLFSFGDNIVVMAAILWLGKLVHEMLGFKSKLMVFSPLYDFSPWRAAWAFPLFIICLSCGLLFLFARYVLKMPFKDSWNGPRDRTDPFTKDYDRVSAVTEKLIKGKMKALRRTMGGHKKGSLYQLARMYQVALFSPGYASIINSLIGMAGTLFYLCTFFYIFYGGSKVKDEILFLFILLYFMGAGMLTTDFLQHRHRMPAIWLQSRLNSRKRFASVTFLTYLMVMARQYLNISIGVLCVHLLLFDTPVFLSLPVMAAGLAIFISLLSLSLLFSDRIVSADGKGWMIFSTCVGILCMSLQLILIRSPRSPAMWYVVLVMGIFSLILLRGAYLKWRGTEMNFNAPNAF
jgi:hypothetical protein